MVFNATYNILFMCSINTFFYILYFHFDIEIGSDPPPYHSLVSLYDLIFHIYSTIIFLFFLTNDIACKSVTHTVCLFLETKIGLIQMLMTV
jgi:hypothetical protein